MTVTGTTELTWKDVLAEEKEKPYFQEILEFLKRERAAGKTIYPPQAEIFNALKYTPFEKVKVVIIGQDPYHGPKQAHGMCFSVRQGVRPPPSLQNIFKELHDDCGFSMPDHGCLEGWSKQGVLLLNTSLTVEAGKAASHANIGWQQFTDKIITVLNEKKQGLVFLLWGAHAQQKGSLVDPTRHFVLKAAHPSPFSANNGFFGCKHFSKTNRFLQQQGRDPINWQL